MKALTYRFKETIELGIQMLCLSVCQHLTCMLAAPSSPARDIAAQGSYANCLCFRVHPDSRIRSFFGYYDSRMILSSYIKAMPYIYISLALLIPFQPLLNLKVRNLMEFLGLLILLHME